MDQTHRPPRVYERGQEENAERQPDPPAVDLAGDGALITARELGLDLRARPFLNDFPVRIVDNDLGGVVPIGLVEVDLPLVLAVRGDAGSNPDAPEWVRYLRADGSGRETVARTTAATAWLGDRLLRDESADAAPFEQQICLLASNTDFPCERLVAGEPGHDLWDPAVSPDGSLVAATRAPVDTFQGELLQYPHVKPR